MDRAAIADRLAADPRIQYALLFGSRARGHERDGSDVDIAVGRRKGASFELLELGGLVADLEAIAGKPVDIVFVDKAPTLLAWRIFREGILLFERDHRARVADKTQAILNYHDFAPTAAMLTAGVLKAARNGRR